MTESPAVAYLALDIETTGLSPKDDQILEVAWKALDESLRDIEGTEFSQVVQLTASGWDRLAAAPEVVRKMHSVSGLLGDVIGSKNELASIKAALHRTVSKLRDDYDRVHLLGMSVHFDAEFLKDNGFQAHFDDSTRIHHRMYDISSVKLALDQAGVDYPKAPKGNHRAAADVQEAIDQARLFHVLFAPQEADMARASGVE